eukprot:g864.t1
MSSSVPKLKLMYFNIPGKGEPIRLACSYLKIPFEDYRFKSREEFLSLKESGELPFGQVPCLKIQSNDSDADEKSLVQSIAILKYVASLKPGTLYPKDDIFEAAKIDSILLFEADAMLPVLVTRYTTRFSCGDDVISQEGHANLRKHLS